MKMHYRKGPEPPWPPRDPSLAHWKLYKLYDYIDILKEEPYLDDHRSLIAGQRFAVQISNCCLRVYKE